MPIRRLSMTAQVKKTHSKSGKGRMGPGKRGRPRKNESAVVRSSASGEAQAKEPLGKGVAPAVTAPE
jgi:hypothetical protein